MPYQIVYASKSTTPMQMDDLEDILESARESNAEVEISGALVYVDGFFLQILEGEADAVLELMGRISRDVRHETVTVLKRGDISTAIFSDWKMAYVSASAEQVARWAGLRQTSSMSDVLADMNGDASRVSQVAEQILRVLATEARDSPSAA